ncbi:MAG: cobyrinate a,c-diamide synthase [Gammaproteobacteria bacterium]|nr:cobyrinate a,c-diamide synthase [Gammaproteobacteria bacterium]
MPRLFVSAAHKSSGKTTVSVGIAAALRARGVVVQPFKKGPDYIDPMWLAAAAGRSCRNLDFHTMAQEEIRAEFAQRSQGAGLALVEGNKGLHDGVSVDGADSNAALAKLLAAPVVLVVDTRGITRGIAPLLHGYREFDPGVRIAGVILNRVAGARHEGKLVHAVRTYTDLPVLGAIGRTPELALDSAHIGLVPTAEIAETGDRVERIAQRIEADVDLDRVRGVADRAGTLDAVPAPRVRPRLASADPDVRIAVARDAAFCFYYPGDLEALEAAGARLVAFDTLRDPAPPEADGVFIGGGFPERAMDDLEANAPMRVSLGERIAAGLPVYAECGGLMYLARRIRWNERDCEMVGAIPADVVMHPRPRGRGYVVLEPTGDGPWAPAASGPVHAHEFHHSTLENMAGTHWRYAYRVRRGCGIDGEKDGIVIGSLLASYSHLRDVEGCRWAERFVSYVRRCKGRPIEN